MDVWLNKKLRVKDSIALSANIVFSKDLRDSSINLGAFIL